MNQKPTLILYYKETCPFCKKVLSYLEDLKKTLPMKSIKGHPENLAELEKLTGKKQVPCLSIDNEGLLESDAIILWIEEHKMMLEDIDPQKRL